MKTVDLIDQYIKKFKAETEKFNADNWKHMYNLGKLIASNVPEIIEVRRQQGKEFSYVSWKWYEYILRKFDNKAWWEISHADQFRVETTLIWNGEISKASYAVEDSAFRTDPKTKLKTNERLNNISEQTINEGMRCYAKHASRKTGLFLHLWYEGGNN